MPGGMIVGATVGGGVETKAALKNLDAKLQKKIMRKATTQAIKPMLAACRANIPVKTGFTKKALATRVNAYPSGKVVGMVGVRRGLRLLIKSGALEGASVQRTATRKVVTLTAKKFKAKAAIMGTPNKGEEHVHMPSKILHLIEARTHFMQGAFDSSAGQGVAAFAGEVKTGVEGGG